MIDYEVLGDVLIPLENGNFLSKKSPIYFQDLNTCNYKSFRKILFQGETLKFYIVIQSSKQNIPNILTIFDKMNFNIEFESTEIDINNLKINNAKNTNLDGQDGEDEKPTFKFYCSNNNIEEDNNNMKINKFNKEFEIINKKEYDKDSFSEVYEIIKEIIVPDNYINSNLLMKVNIYIDNYSIFSEDNKEDEILNLYHLGILNHIDKYKLLKTIFKEVKVINPLNILNLKQIEQKIDLTLLQTKINNYNIYDLIDNSLKNSKIFKNFNSKKEEIINPKIKNISINDIRILQNETSFDEKATEKIEFIKEKLIKEKHLLNKNDFNITLFNKNKYPYVIGSGEEFNLILKIIKNAYINESINSTNKIYNNNNNSKNKNNPLVIFTQNETTTTQSDVNKIIINTLNDNSLHSSLLGSSKNNEENYNNDFTRKRYSSIVLNKSAISQKVQEPLFSFGNLFKKKGPDDKMSNEISSLNNNDNNNKLNMSVRLKTQKGDINKANIDKNDNRDMNMDMENNSNILDLDNYFDEHFKIYYITPIILNLSSDLFYENINMCIQMKWFNEINRYLIISIIIPEHIKTNQYFEASIKIKNISFNPMNLIIQIKDDENKDSPIANSSKNKTIENVPSILSQTKIEHFGLIDCGNEQIFTLKFLPLIQGYCFLPNLTLIDIYSERKFYFVQTNKIFVEEENK